MVGPSLVAQARSETVKKTATGHTLPMLGVYLEPKAIVERGRKDFDKSTFWKIQITDT